MICLYKAICAAKQRNEGLLNPSPPRMLRNAVLFLESKAQKNSYIRTFVSINVKNI